MEAANVISALSILICRLNPRHYLSSRNDTDSVGGWKGLQWEESSS